MFLNSSAHSATDNDDGDDEDDDDDDDFVKSSIKSLSFSLYLILDYWHRNESLFTAAYPLLVELKPFVWSSQHRYNDVSPILKKKKKCIFYIYITLYVCLQNKLLL